MTGKKRQRVPISCLVCKKRKVKCDKVKPVCGGCTRNRVPHLCQYVEPHWTGAISGKENEQHMAPIQTQNINSSDSDALRKTIQKQRKEIDDLKRKLALSQTTEIKEGPKLSLMTILRKIGTDQKQKIELVDDINFSMVKYQPREFVDVYSLPNNVKLDPHLSELWVKISTLQKMYHIHKKNAEPNAPNDLKCPVIQVDIDSMSKYSAQPVSLQSTPSIDSAPSSLTNAKPDSKQTKNINLSESINMNKDIDDDSKEVIYNLTDKSCIFLQSTQKLWSSTLHLSRVGKMNFEQLDFLLKYYFNNLESSYLIRIYRERIENFICNSDGEAGFHNYIDKNQDELQSFGHSKLCGVYLVMVAIAVNQSLVQFRNQLMTNTNDTSDQNYQHFKKLFPDELSLAGLGPKTSSHIIPQIMDILRHVVNLKLNETHSNSVETLPFFASCIMFLNECAIDISLYKIKQLGFANIFTIFMKSILKHGYAFLWNDPESVSLQNSTPERNNELRDHICLVWNETVRLTNIVTLGIPPLMKITDSTGDLLLKVLSKIESSEENHCHSSYLSNSPNSSHLESTLDADFVISRTCSKLARGVNELKLSKDFLKNLSQEISVWILHEYSSEREGFQYLKFLERQVSLRYLRFFISYLLLLQDEQDSQNRKSEHDILSTYNSVITKLMSLFKFITNELKYIGTRIEYILLVLTEVSSRLIQPICGIILRLYEFEDNNILQKIGQIIDQEFSGEYSISNINDTCMKLVNLMNMIVSKLNYYRNDTTIKLSKTWNFYLVFIKNVHKLNYSNYAKIHANVPSFNNIKLGTKLTNLPLAHQKCPIAHDIGEPQKCPIKLPPIDKSSIIVSNDNPNGKRKCPFDHDALLSRSNSGKINPKESNVRGQDIKLDSLFSPNILPLESPAPPQLSREFSGKSSIENTPTPFMQPAMNSPIVMNSTPSHNPSYRPTSDSNHQHNHHHHHHHMDLLPNILNDFAVLDVDLDFDILSQDLQEDPSIAKMFE